MRNSIRSHESGKSRNLEKVELVRKIRKMSEIFVKSTEKKI